VTKTLRSERAAGTLAVIAAAACASATQRSPSGDVRPADQAIVSPAAQAKADSGRPPRPPYGAADVQFMTGMIGHHAQAVLMAGWAPSHGASAAVRVLCERIVVTQRDDIALMQRWLGERHETVPPPPPPAMMPGLDHPMLTPGMLTAAQIAQLDSARGPEFDRLFLSDMIQHHGGALTMVRQLLDTQGAAQDGLVFQFAADVNADQTVEIDRMTRMLEALHASERSPL
jgi:uncharacterized protein (DUF305 family)